MKFHSLNRMNSCHDSKSERYSSETNQTLETKRQINGRRAKTKIRKKNELQSGVSTCKRVLLDLEQNSQKISQKAPPIANKLNSNLN